ncbi:hypothetical protein Pan4_41 [Pseudanabaena phage Pan4]|nr:hypothetical protein Pan4_41 [Pseudanabaena phage Pan4]
MKRDVDLMRELLLLAADDQPETVRIKRDTVMYYHLLLLNDLALLSRSDDDYSITELGKRVAAIIADDCVWSRWKDASGDRLGLVFSQLVKLIADEAKTPPEGGDGRVVCQCGRVTLEISSLEFADRLAAIMDEQFSLAATACPKIEMR